MSHVMAQMLENDWNGFDLNDMDYLTQHSRFATHTSVEECFWSDKLKTQNSWTSAYYHQDIYFLYTQKRTYLDKDSDQTWK